LMMLVTDGLVVHAAYRGLNNFTEHDK